MPTVHLLDYVAGNIRSLVNAINRVGYEVEWVKTPEDVKNADVSARECHWMRRTYQVDFVSIFDLLVWVVEIDPPRCRPLRPLPLATRQRRFPRTNSKAY